MDDKLFGELLDSAKEALEHAEGKLDLRTTTLPPEPKPMTSAEVKRLRKRLNASQSVFARCLNVSPKLVQAWEANRRTPEGPALLLLRLAEQRPAFVCRGLKLSARTKNGSSTRVSGARGKRARGRRYAAKKS